MKSDLPNETIKPAYPLGDANVDAPGANDKKDTPTQPAPKTEPKPEPKKVDEPQTDGE